MTVFTQVEPDVKPTESEDKLEDKTVEDTPSKKSKTRKMVNTVLIVSYLMKFFGSIADSVWISIHFKMIV